MKTTSRILVPVLILMLSACSTSQLAVVNTDYDRDADFSKYTSFYWSDEMMGEDKSQPLIYNSLVQKRIKTAIASQMKGRGYAIEEDNPDLMVNFHVIVEEKTDYRYASNPGWYGWWNNQNVVPYNYKEGTLVIDLIDRENKQLVWQGYVEGVIADEPEEKEEKIRTAVSTIFSKYPFRAGSNEKRDI